MRFGQKSKFAQRLTFRQTWGTSDPHWEVYLVRRELDLTVADGILGEIRRRPN